MRDVLLPSACELGPSRLWFWSFPHNAHHVPTKWTFILLFVMSVRGLVSIPSQTFFEMLNVLRLAKCCELLGSIFLPCCLWMDGGGHKIWTNNKNATVVALPLRVSKLACIVLFASPPHLLPREPANYFATAGM